MNYFDYISQAYRTKVEVMTSHAIIFFYWWKMKTRTYFDYAATTPVDSGVLSAMLPYFVEEFGNPSSIHEWGQKAEAALNNARDLCGKCLNISPDNVIFTSGGTESDNLAVRGTALFRRKTFGADEIISTPVEHQAILKTAIQLKEEFGFKLVIVPVDKFGMVDPDDIKKRISSKTALVSIIYGNNEIGTINPIEKIGAICTEQDIPFHSDAVQAAAHLPMDMTRDHLSMISLGAHKMYGPKGIGLLGMNSLNSLIPTQTGGGQEAHLRAGTQNIPLIIGLTAAFTKAQNEIPQRNSRILELRDHIIFTILEKIPGTYLTGHPTNRLPNHASFVFDGVDGNRLLMILDSKGFACSSGSACKVGSPTPSEVLLSMGINPELALGSLRITLGKETTLEQTDSLLTAIAESVLRIRK
jgi:cysteine desulfurase